MFDNAVVTQGADGAIVQKRKRRPFSRETAFFPQMEQNMKNKKNNELAVCGFAAVKKLEKNHRDQIRRLYFTKEVAPFFGGLCRFLSQNHGIYNQVDSEDELTKLSGTVHHQGVVAMIFMPSALPLDSDITDDWIKNGEHAVILDGVGNANNVGAIVRSAAFFGIKNIVISEDYIKTALTTSAYRVAEGGMEYVRIYSVRSIPRLIEVLRGTMAVIGTDLAARKSSVDLHSIRRGKPAVLVLGNEEEGISGLIKKLCDDLVIIPFGGMKSGNAEPCVDSLNVAQASAVLFYELTK